MIGVLIASVPVASGIAATRPNTAVPMASSAATATAVQDDDNGGISWVAVAVIGVAVAAALFLILNNDDDEDGSLSLGYRFFFHERTPRRSNRRGVFFCIKSNSDVSTGYSYCAGRQAGQPLAQQFLGLEERDYLGRNLLSFWASAGWSLSPGHSDTRTHSRSRNHSPWS